MAQRALFFTLLVPILVGCGGGGTTTDETATTDETVAPTTGAESEPVFDETADSSGVHSPTLTALLNQPEIDVYVDGPDRVDSEPLAAGDAADFETQVRVVLRTYVGFEGEALVGDFDLERHYAGRTEITVRG